MSLYKDASLAMIPTAYKDGKLYSIRPIPEYGAEEVTNGDFATDSSWTKGTGVTISNGSATSSTGGVYIVLNQSTSIVVGTIYQYSFNVTIVSGGIRLGDTSSVWSNTATSSGIYSGSVTAANGVIYFTSPSSDFVGSINSVSVKKVLVADGDFTFTRGSNLSATRVNASQLIEKGRENLLLNSNGFTTSWILTGSGSSLGSDVAGPIAGVTGKALTMVTGALLYQTITSIPLGVMSVYMRVSSGTIDLQLGDPLGAPYSTKTLTTTWQRFSTLDTASLGGLAIYNSQSGTTINIEIAAAQVELGLVATPYIESGATTGKAGILENTPRFDYSGGATCPSLLLEPSRSNLLTQSEYFGSSDWTKTGASVVSGFTSPEGLSNAYNLVEDTSTGVHRTFGLTPTATGLYSMSFRVKANGRTKVGLSESSNGAFWGTFNLTTGVVIDTEASTTGKIVPMEDNWYEISITGTSTIFDLRSGIYALNDSYTTGTPLTYSYTGDGTSGLYIYGAQLEAGSYPTSYIPTYGVSQTRAQDLCLGAGDASTFNDSEGVLFLDINLNFPRPDLTTITLSDGTTNNQIDIRFYSTYFQIFIKNAFYQLSYNVLSISDFNKFAFYYNNGNSKVYINGTDYGNATYTGSFSGLNKFNLAWSSAAAPFHGNVKQTIYFPTALSDAELASLTTI
tara:strand:+ start:567 stop:2603 length:2037 start_codon:yes stop_codon:yes gene_type:complete